MALVSHIPWWETVQQNEKEDNKVYRILHLRDAYFLDNMFFKGRKAAEDYLHKHMCKVAEISSDNLPWARIIIKDNQLLHFEIIEA